MTTYQDHEKRNRHDSADHDEPTDELCSCRQIDKLNQLTPGLK